MRMIYGWYVKIPKSMSQSPPARPPKPMSKTKKGEEEEEETRERKKGGSNSNIEKAYFRVRMAIYSRSVARIETR